MGWSWSFSPNANAPTLAQLQQFVQNVAGISPNYLPLSSPQYQYALDQALNIVNPALAVAPGQPDGSWTPYQMAVLNLATHLIIAYGQDVSWPVIAAAASGAPWYATLTLAPVAPVLTPSGSGGSLPSGSVYVVVAYAYVGQTGTPSPEASAVVTGPNGSLSVASPTAAPGAIGWWCYAASASGAEVLQNASPAAIGTPLVLMSLVSGASPPTFAVMPGDSVAVSGISPSPYCAGAWKPFTTYSVSAPGAQAKITYPLVANDNAGYPNANNPGAATVLPGAAVRETLFYTLRQRFGITRFQPGMVANASDQGTGAGLLNPDFMRRLQFQDLDYAKTPYGRDYLALAQRFGPVLAGLT